MAERGGGAGSGHGFLRPVVLAPAGMARPPRTNGRDRALAMAGGDSIGRGIHGCHALRLGLRMDGTRDPCACCSAYAISGGGLLPLPMYVGVAVGWVGLSVVVGHANPLAPARGQPP